ncbi:MAG TPA: CerR family C-terminal domain-containing protein [Geobacteraceae bacterium]|nr:CerR family C-terminal domain-containing protein [Geobacteraceae bacterium]
MTLETKEARRMLLETAAAVFAEHGFAATTVRMICGRAKWNVSAVYYHFGSKEEFYHEVLHYARRAVYDKYPVTYGLNAGATPEDRLYAFIRSFLLRIFGDECKLGFGTLIMREMVEPSRALDVIVDEGIRSLFDQLVEIVQVLMGDDADRDLVLACSRNTISQCLIYLCSRSVINRMAPGQTFETDDIENISEEVTSFTLNALRGMAKNKGGRPQIVN